MPDHVKHLIERGDKLHSDRGTLLSLWQEIAWNFYPERADFTYKRELGAEFAENLYSSYPLIARRELGNAFTGMLRPRTKEWFHMTVEDDESLSHAAKVWLERATKIQRKAMYDRKSGFVRATKEGDQDFASFGQCVIQRELDWERPGLLYRSHHLRDTAWAEKPDGTINEIHRNWKPTIGDLCDKFGEQCHELVKKNKDKEPFKKVNCRAVVMPADAYGGESKFNTPWAHAYIDCENQHLMEEVGVYSHGYTIPRWQTVSGSQYAYSPATIAGLADARLIQAMTLTLLEAGEMAVRPAMLATQEAIRSDIALFPGGITWVEADYDEKTGRALSPINQDLRGLPFGLEQQVDIREMLATAFYLDKITMPMRSKEMTAYEASKLFEQYIRDAIPLFEPMETDYNGTLCEDTFEALMRVGTFGPVEEVPEELLEKDITFRFESPLHDAIERQQAETFIESTELINQAAELDQNALGVQDTIVALRDSLKGIGQPTEWMRDEDEYKKWAADRAEAAQASEDLALAQQGADVAKTANES